MIARIVIAEDHKLFRQGLKIMITSHLQHEVCGEAGDGFEAIRLVENLRPDLLIIDLSMPGLGGTEVIRKLRKRGLETRVLVVSMHASEKYLQAALLAGADGYLLKLSDQSEFEAAVTGVLAGKRYISSEFGDVVAEHYQGCVENSLADALTPREKEVLCLVAEGFSNRKIGEILCISPKTVDNHRTNIMRKLDLHSVLELANFVRETGLAEFL